MAWNPDEVNKIVGELVKNDELATRIYAAVNEAADKTGVRQPLDEPTFWAVMSAIRSYSESELGPWRYFTKLQ